MDKGLEGVWKGSGRGLECVWKVFGKKSGNVLDRAQEGVLVRKRLEWVGKGSRRILEGVRKESGRGLKGS